MSSPLLLHAPVRPAATAAFSASSTTNTPTFFHTLLLPPPPKLLTRIASNPPEPPLLALVASHLLLDTLLRLQRCSSALHRLRADGCGKVDCTRTQKTALSGCCVTTA